MAAIGAPQLAPAEPVVTQHLQSRKQVSQYFTPKVVPSRFAQAFEKLKTGTQIPIIIPTEGLTDIYPYILTLGRSEYEISLDFTPDCQGAGACYGGTITGKKVNSDKPVSTRNFEFDRKRAHLISLIKGVKGYFMDFTCGANCNDAKVFWIQNGHQFMVGIKGGKREDVIKMANAAISNQTH